MFLMYLYVLVKDCFIAVTHVAKLSSIRLEETEVD